MDRGRHLALSIALIVAGLALVAFFALLLGIADCSAACVERGEQAPAFGLIGAGAGMVVAGAAAMRAPVRRGAAFGLLVAGAVGAAGVAWSLAHGARGAPAWLVLALSLGVLALGLWLRGGAAQAAS